MDVRLYPCHARSTRRAGLTRAALFAHVVEGKSYTTRQVANRLAISTGAALKRAKRGPFPLTWSALSAARIPKNKELSNV